VIYTYEAACTIQDNTAKGVGRKTLRGAIERSSELTLTLKHQNLFGKTKWRYFSGKCPDTSQGCPASRTLSCVKSEDLFIWRNTQFLFSCEKNLCSGPHL